MSNSSKRTCWSWSQGLGNLGVLPREQVEGSGGNDAAQRGETPVRPGDFLRQRPHRGSLGKVWRAGTSRRRASGENQLEIEKGCKGRKGTVSSELRWREKGQTRRRQGDGRKNGGQETHSERSKNRLMEIGDRKKLGEGRRDRVWWERS